MRRLAFFLFFAIHFPGLSAQDTARFIVRLDSIGTGMTLSIPFAAIQVIDARFNRDDIGTVSKDYSLKGRTQEKMLAVFPENLETYLPHLLAPFLQADTPTADTLMILVKQFRIADHIPIPIAAHQLPASILTVSCTFFSAANGEYRRIHAVERRMRARWSENYRINTEDMIRQREMALTKLVSEVFAGVDWQRREKSFPVAELEAAMQIRFNLPFLVDAAVQPGIYRSYREFQQNAPSLPIKEIVKQKDEISEVKLHSENRIDPDSVWGLSDGEHTYISFVGKWYKLHRSGQRFYIVFPRKISHIGLFRPDADPELRRGQPMANARPQRQYGLTFRDSFEYGRRPEALYLNLESGQIHVEEIIGTANIDRIAGML